MSDQIPRKWWILKTPGGTFLEYDEPMNYDWSLCSKVKVLEAAPVLAEIEQRKQLNMLNVMRIAELEEILQRYSTGETHQKVVEERDALAKELKFTKNQMVTEIREATEWQNSERMRLVRELEAMKTQCDALKAELSVAKQDRDSWKRAHQTSQEAANGLIGKLEARLGEYESK